jgi:site-specific DNA-cytosine methylase
MRVLVACEESQRVCQAFRDKGHEAYSCDILPTSGTHPEWHIQDDVMEHLNDGWDMMIAHPPCTHLSVSGARWFKYKGTDQDLALRFVQDLLMAKTPRICVENPVSIISTRIRKPDQIIQPWQFGHGETKATCLWLKGLPKLQPTNIVEGREARVHKMAPGPNRARDRARTYPGIAEAMATQWNF